MAGTKRILIIDEDDDVLDLLGAALRREDRQVDCVDPAHARAALSGDALDLVIVDLPGSDGMALVEQIHSAQPQAAVVVMTASPTPVEVIDAIRGKVFSYFCKPFSKAAVAEMVDRALAHEDSDDDIEVLSARPNWLAVRLRCKVETANRILQFFRELNTGLPEVEREHIATAFREIVMNAVEHGGGSDPQKHVVISHVRARRALLYYVRDPGRGFSLSDLPHAAVSNSEESPFAHAEIRERMGLRPGGFGLLMTRQLVDEMIYNEAGNEVLLIKYLPDTD